MHGGKYGVDIFVLCVAIGAVAAAATDAGDVDLRTSSKLLTGLTGVGGHGVVPGIGGGGAAIGGGGQGRVPGGGGINLLDPLGFAKNTRDLVQGAIRFPRPKDYIQSFMRISLEQFRQAMNHMSEMAKQADDSLNKMAADDCNELLNYAIDELQESMSSVSDCPLEFLMQRLVDLKNWLSAVLTFSNTCMDGFTKPNLQSSIHNFLKASTWQASQALTIVSGIPQILAGLNIHAHGSASMSANANANANMAAAGNMAGGGNMAGNGNSAGGGNMAGNGNANPTSSSGENAAATSGGSDAVDGGANMAGNENQASSSGGENMVGGANMAGGGAGPRFPGWMPKADRKLLMSAQGGGPGPAGGGGGVNLQPNAVVAKDGSGQYSTIMEALNAYDPKTNTTRHVIYVKAGVYVEDVIITKKQTNIFMYGDGPEKTVVTGKKCNRDGVSTFRTAPFAVVGNGFICKSMGFENTAGPEGHQAVALRVQSDMAAFYNCRMDGYQDTLYTHAHRQFYSNCVISGTVDFIFGDAAAIIQDSTIIVRKPMDNQQNIITAHGRTHMAEPTGLVIQNCQIVAEDALIAKKAEIKSYLARPWKPYSRTVIMESTIGDFIQPEGYLPWAGNIGIDTCYYAEYGNKGPAADTSKRVNWKGYHVLNNANEAMMFTVEKFIQGNQWLPATGAPFFLGLKAAQ